MLDRLIKFYSIVIDMSAPGNNVKEEKKEYTITIANGTNVTVNNVDTYTITKTTGGSPSDYTFFGEYDPHFINSKAPLLQMYPINGVFKYIERIGEKKTTGGRRRRSKSRRHRKTRRIRKN